MQKHSVNAAENFIGGWYLDDLSICDELINYFNELPADRKAEGSSKGYANNAVNKKSLETYMYGTTDVEKRYNKALQQVIEQYIEQYTYSAHYSPWQINEYPKIQYYKPFEGFLDWHTERTKMEFPIISRHLVFMTYLNDVSDAGETEFYYQKVKVKPEKGLTLIWPADWTFTHRGITSPTEEKYILTGWYNYVA